MSNYHSVSAQLFTLKSRNPKDKNHLNIYGVIQDGVIHQQHQQRKEKRRDRLLQIVFLYFCENNNGTLFVLRATHDSNKGFFMRFEKL